MTFVQRNYSNLSVGIILFVAGIVDPTLRWAFWSLGVIFYLSTISRIGGSWQLSFIAFGFTLFACLQKSGFRLGVIAALIISIIAIEIYRKQVYDEDRAIIPWRILCQMCIFAIAYVSGGEGGAGGWASWFIETFHIDLQTADNIIFVVRKCIHFSFYGLLTLAIWQWCRRVYNEINAKVIVAHALTICFGFACFDEIRQFFTAGRTGLASDVAIDLAGGVVFLYLGSTFITKVKTT